jgi:hypothetical protein
LVLDQGVHLSDLDELFIVCPPCEVAYIMKSLATPLIQLLSPHLLDFQGFDGQTWAGDQILAMITLLQVLVHGRNLGAWYQTVKRGFLVRLNLAIIENVNSSGHVRSVESLLVRRNPLRNDVELWASASYIQFFFPSQQIDSSLSSR